MWIFRVKRPPGSPPVFKARYVAQGFSQRQGLDFFQTFSPTSKMTTLRVLLHVATQRDYELHSLDFNTAFLHGSLHEEILLCHPPGFTGSFPASTQRSLRRPVYGLCRRLASETTHRGRHLQLLDTSLPPFYIPVYVDDLVFATADTEALTLVKSKLQKRRTCTDQELVGCLMYLMTCTRPDLAYPLSILARYVAPGRHRPKHWKAAKRVLRYLCNTSGIRLKLEGRGPVVLTEHADVSWVDDLATQWSSQGYTFSLGSNSVSWRSTRSSSVLNSSCEAEIYAGAMAAHELRWLTYLLTDLGERPRSPPIMYVDNKAMIALCQEHRLEHRTKHIALRYFLARELQQRGQLRLAYMATRANTTDMSNLCAIESQCDFFLEVQQLGVHPARAASAANAVSASTATTAATAAMASPTVLTFDAEGRAVDFDVWWTTRVAVARLAVPSHLPSAERAHFGQYKTAKSLYDAVIVRYSSPATAALNRLMLPYLFPDLAAFATVADLITHLRTSDARYRAALPTEDHFLSLCTTELTVDLLEERLTAAEKSIVAVGASRGDPRAPFFEGCSHVPLLPSVASAAAVDLVGAEVGAASAPSGRRRNSKGKGGKGGGGDGGGGGGGGGGDGGGGGEGGGGGGSGGFGGGGGGGRGSGSGGGGSGSGGGGGGGGGAGRRRAAQCGGFGGSQRQQQPRSLLEGDCYLCVPPDRGIEAAALGASESAAPSAGEPALSGTAPTEALHTFTLDSGASRSFFRDSTTLTPLSRLVAVSLGDPSGDPVLAHSSTVLPCPAAPSGLLSGLHLPSFSTNLVSGADLQDLWVNQFTPGGFPSCTQLISSSIIPFGAVGAGGDAGTSAAAGGTGAVPAGSGDPARPRPYFVPLLEQVLGIPPSSGLVPSLECPQPVQSQSLLQPVSPLPAPSPYTSPTGGLAERREPASRPASPVRAARTSGRAPRPRPPALPRTHQMALRPSTASQRVPLPSPPASSLPVLADPESDSLRAASPTIARLLSTVVTDPSFESAAASALVAELVDFAACCRLDYAAGLVAESASVCPPSVGGFPTCTQLISSSIIPCSLHNLATFTRRPGSSLYTLTTASPPVTVSGQVAASSQVFAAASSQVFAAAYRSSPASAPCSCRPLSHETLLWHHRLGHPSLPRLRDMASRTLVSGLPWSLPPLPPGPAPTCVPCVEGRQRAAPHSSEFPLTEAPLQALHMDVWGPARVRGQCHERYFLLVVDDYSRYTTVFPLRRKGEVTEGIRQTFTLPASPQQNGIAERRIGMVMDVARTSMIHAAAPHFLWLFAVQYAAHQINLQPRVSLPETTPTLRWTGKVGDASVFCVYGSRAFVRDTFADKLSSRVVPCVFLGFPPDALGWQFYHPTLRRVLSSRDVTVLPPQGVSQVDPVEPVEVAVDSGAARGAEPGRVEPRGAEPGGAESGGAEPAGAGPGGAEPRVAESEGAEPGGAEPARVEPGGAEPGGAESRGVEPAGDEPERAESGGPPGVQSWREPLSPQRLQEWYARRCSHAAGATGPAAGGASGAKAAGGAAGAGAAGAAGPGGAGAGGTGAVGGSTSVGVAGGAGATGPGGARTGGTGATGPGGAAGVGAVVAGAVATGGAAGAGAAGGTGAGGSA
ncbi:unnamed protein product [Closterium sp. NIES-54]